MDPITAIGAVASIVQLAQLALSLSKAIYGIGNAIASASDDLRNLADDLSQFSQSLTVLSRMLEDSKSCYTDEIYLMTAKIIKDCADLYVKVDNILKKLSRRGSNSLRTRFKFVAKESEIKRLMQRLRDMKGTLQTILTTLQVDLSLSILHISSPSKLQRRPNEPLKPSTIETLKEAQRSVTAHFFSSGYYIVQTDQRLSCSETAFPMISTMSIQNAHLFAADDEKVVEKAPGIQQDSTDSLSRQLAHTEFFQRSHKESQAREISQGNPGTTALRMASISDTSTDAFTAISRRGTNVMKDTTCSLKSSISIDSFKSAVSVQEASTNPGSDVTHGIHAIQSVMHAFRTALETLQKLIDRRIPRTNLNLYSAAGSLSSSLSCSKNRIRELHSSKVQEHEDEYLDAFNEPNTMSIRQIGSDIMANVVMTLHLYSADHEILKPYKFEILESHSEMYQRRALKEISRIAGSLWTFIPPPRRETYYLGKERPGIATTGIFNGTMTADSMQNSNTFCNPDNISSRDTPPTPMKLKLRPSPPLATLPSSRYSPEISLGREGSNRSKNCPLIGDATLASYMEGIKRPDIVRTASLESEANRLDDPRSSLESPTSTSWPQDNTTTRRSTIDASVEDIVPLHIGVADISEAKNGNKRGLVGFRQRVSNSKGNRKGAGREGNASIAQRPLQDRLRLSKAQLPNIPSPSKNSLATPEKPADGDPALPRPQSQARSSPLPTIAIQQDRKPRPPSSSSRLVESEDFKSSTTRQGPRLLQESAKHLQQHIDQTASAPAPNLMKPHVDRVLQKGERLGSVTQTADATAAATAAFFRAAKQKSQNVSQQTLPEHSLRSNTASFKGFRKSMSRSRRSYEDPIPRQICAAFIHYLPEPGSSEENNSVSILEENPGLSVPTESQFKDSDRVLHIDSDKPDSYTISAFPDVKIPPDMGGIDEHDDASDTKPKSEEKDAESENNVDYEKDGIDHRGKENPYGKLRFSSESNFSSKGKAQDERANKKFFVDDLSQSLEYISEITDKNQETNFEFPNPTEDLDVLRDFDFNRFLHADHEGKFGRGVPNGLGVKESRLSVLERSPKDFVPRKGPKLRGRWSDSQTRPTRPVIHASKLHSTADGASSEHFSDRPNILNSGSTIVNNIASTDRSQDDNSPLFVNAKQFHRILKRRTARRDLEELRKFRLTSVGTKLPYRHGGPAMRRPRSPGGRSLSTSKISHIEEAPIVGLSLSRQDTLWWQSWVSLVNTQPSVAASLKDFLDRSLCVKSFPQYPADQKLAAEICNAAESMKYYNDAAGMKDAIEIRNDINNIISTIASTLRLESALLGWASVVGCLLELEHHFHSTTPIVPATAEIVTVCLNALLDIVGLVARYVVMENLYRANGAMVLKDEYRAELIGLCTKILEFFVGMDRLIARLGDKEESEAMDNLKEIVKDIKKSDEKCRGFRVTVEEVKDERHEVRSESGSGSSIEEFEENEEQVFT